ncbi:SMI1/KNR4 family protein [Streptomyces vastus]|uniref:SMI1/KNR4 family protein n=1 Tax=Streptomyces vastus TaxID=285451 RepID=A0ABP6D666_9ACTN
MTISDAWYSIETWLQSRAPATYASLPDPASNEELEALERGIQMECPDALRESLLRHNGSEECTLPVFYRFSSIRQIEYEYKEMVKADERRAKELRERHRERPNQFPALMPGEHPFWSPGWIPFCYNEGGDLLFLSQTEGETLGRVGKFGVDSGASFDDNSAFMSLAHLLEATVNALHAGRFEIWGEWHPYVDSKGFLDWRDAEEF